jgi:protein SCO1/2
MWKGKKMKSIIIYGALISAGILMSQAHEGEIASGTNKPSCCTKELAAGAALPERSIYQSASQWTNDVAKAASLESLRGRPQVVTMFFAECQFTCPILVHSMKQIEAALPEGTRTNVGFVLISFDPERDTPAALAKYRQTHELGANWTLLRGGADDVMELAALLGVKYKKDVAGNFAHSNIITVLNDEGEIAFQELGVNRDPLNTVNALQKLFPKLN